MRTGVHPLNPLINKYVEEIKVIKIVVVLFYVENFSFDVSITNFVSFVLSLRPINLVGSYLIDRFTEDVK